MTQQNTKSFGGMLSSSDFKEFVIQDNVQIMKDIFINRNWKELESKEKQRHFLIDPFNPLNLTPFSYDLSTGDQAVSCKLETRSSFLLNKENGNPYWLEPNETIIVNTKEYIALPPCYSATVWPRFNVVNEGIFQSMVKIDPTWYGKLAVAITNLSPSNYPMWKDVRFCTLVIYELSSNTDISLYKEGEKLPNEIKIELPNDLDDNDLIDKIKKLGLRDKCIIKDMNLYIPFALNRKELEKDAKGQRLNRNKILENECSQALLDDTAIQWGKPFDLIANMPRMMENRINPRVIETVQSELEKEISTNILPRVLTYMFSLLATLSLIIAVIGLLFQTFQLKVPFDFDWPSTLLIILLFSLTSYIVTLRFLRKKDKNIDLVNIKIKEIETLFSNEIDRLKVENKTLNEKIKNLLSKNE